MSAAKPLTCTIRDMTPGSRQFPGVATSKGRCEYHKTDVSFWGKACPPKRACSVDARRVTSRGRLAISSGSVVWLLLEWSGVRFNREPARNEQVRRRPTLQLTIEPKKWNPAQEDGCQCPKIFSIFNFTTRFHYNSPASFATPLPTCIILANFEADGHLFLISSALHCSCTQGSWGPVTTLSYIGLGICQKAPNVLVYAFLDLGSLQVRQKCSSTIAGRFMCG